MTDDLRKRVTDERTRRNLSVRSAATLGRTSNTSWSRYEAGGQLTRAMIAAVASAFQWPLDWATGPSAVPSLHVTREEMEQVRAEVAELRNLLEAQRSQPED